MRVGFFLMANNSSCKCFFIFHFGIFAIHNHHFLHISLHPFHCFLHFRDHVIINHSIFHHFLFFLFSSSILFLFFSFVTVNISYEFFYILCTSVTITCSCVCNAESTIPSALSFLTFNSLLSFLIFFGDMSCTLFS